MIYKILKGTRVLPKTSVENSSSNWATFLSHPEGGEGGVFIFSCFYAKHF